MARKVASGFLRPFAARVRALGRDPSVVGAGMGLIDPSLREVEWLTPRQVRDWLDRASALAGDFYLGLNAALERPIGSFGLVEFLARSAPTTLDAFRARLRYASLLNEASESFLHEGTDVASYGVMNPEDPLGLGRHGHEWYVASTLGFIREALGEGWCPRRVWFSHPAVQPIDRLREVFGTAELAFDRPDNGMAIDLADVRRPQRHADPPLHAYLEGRAMRAASRLGRTSLLTDLRRHLAAQLARGSDDAGELARAFHMSRRTLHRRLAADGLTFKSLVDQVRKEIAERTARESELHVEQLSAGLGYSNVPAFLRAFKRWTGMSPTAYRRAVVAQRSSSAAAGSRAHDGNLA